MYMYMYMYLKLSYYHYNIWNEPFFQMYDGLFEFGSVIIFSCVMAVNIKVSSSTGSVVNVAAAC